jgi:hypothetical protein
VLTLTGDWLTSVPGVTGYQELADFLTIPRSISIPMACSTVFLVTSR